MIPTGPLKCAALTSDFGESSAPTMRKMLVAASLTCDHGVGWLKTTRPQSIPKIHRRIGVGFASPAGPATRWEAIDRSRFTVSRSTFPPAFSFRKGTISSRLKIGFPLTATIRSFGSQTRLIGD